MRKRRFSRLVSVVVSMTVCVAMCFTVFSFVPALCKTVSASACFINSCGTEDADHGYINFETKGYNSGDSLIVSFRISRDFLNNDQITCSKGAKLYSYNGSNIVSVKVTGNNGNPNGKFSVYIADTNIGIFSATLQEVREVYGDNPVAAVDKPGEGGPGGGPAGPGEGGPGGKEGPGNGPGNGPGGNGPGGDGPAGPGEKDKDKKEPEKKEEPGKKEDPAQKESSVAETTAAPETTSVTETTTKATNAPETSNEPTAATTAKPAESTTATENNPPADTLPDNSEETTTEVVETSPASDVSDVAVPGVVDPDTGNTDPSDGGVAETTAASGTVPAKPAKASADYSSFIWLLIIALLLLIVYLRYRHLKKKDMSFPEICKNFIPVGALVAKIKSAKKSDDTVLDGPQPEVMNGYLQKPTVGLAAAQAIRPVRSNVSAPVSSTKAPSNRPSGVSSAKAGSAAAAAKTSASRPAQTPVRRSSFKTTDPELLEMERKQAELERKLKDLASHKEKLPGVDEVG
ncbi:MAG: hypothetical protein IKR22_07325 [Clostridiales bacterium]|nr:hypothetical protein [Clostridiales bacterium]